MEVSIFKWRTVLGGKPAFALQQPSLQLGLHLGMGVFFQFSQHDVTGVLKQIHGTPLLGALLPYLSRGWDNGWIGGDETGTLGTIGRSFWPPSGLGHALPIHPLLWQDPVATSLPPHILLGSLSGYDPSTRSGFGEVLQLGAAHSEQPPVHWSVVVWLWSLVLWLFVPCFFWKWLDVVWVQWAQRLVVWLDAPGLSILPNELTLDHPVSYITHDLSINPHLMIMVWWFFHQSCPWTSSRDGGVMFFFPPIPAHSICYKTGGFLNFLLVASISVLR